MDINDLHAALNDLAGTTIDDPGLLGAVRLRARRTRRRRVALTSGSALAVLGVALAAGEGGFSSGTGPLVPASSPATSTTTTSTTSSTLPSPPASARPAPGACAPGDPSVPPPNGGMILSWTGNPPAVGQSFDVTGTVSAVGSDTMTITLPDTGAVNGTLTVSSPRVPPAVDTGATAEFQGTRTGPTTYQVTQASIGFVQSVTESGSAGDAGAGSNPAENPGSSGGAILSWTGTPPAVGESFDVSGTVSAVGSDTVTITLNSAAAVGGTVTLRAAHVPPLAQLGASAELSGTRTGADTYEVTQGSISVGPNSGAGGGSGQVSTSPGTEQEASRPPGGGILSWTGSAPAVGESFDVSGTVTAVGSDTITITLESGEISGTVTVGALCVPPLAQRGDSAELSGTRTGPATYEVTSIGLKQSAKASTP